MTTLGYAAECNTGVRVEEANREDVLRTVDDLARTFLNMSGEAFLALRASGGLDELGDAPQVVRVLSAASLLD